MATIGLVIKPGIEAAAVLALELITWLRSHPHELVADDYSAEILKERGVKAPLKSVRSPQLAQLADPIITLGGDGTLIGVARYAADKTPLMIGVNFGNLGFLTEISPSELIVTLEKVLKGEACSGERSMLLAEVYREGKLVFSSQAVNDVVVQKGVEDRLLDLDCAVDGEDVMRIRADGIIVATPTGSTAYSLSAGGSIVHPSLGVALITPICPHSLTNRPFIIDLNSTIKISVPPYEGRVFVIVDGQVSTPMISGDELKITRAKNKVRFAMSPRKSYFDILRTKLNWGIANKSE